MFFRHRFLHRFLIAIFHIFHQKWLPKWTGEEMSNPLLGIKNLHFSAGFLFGGAFVVLAPFFEYFSRLWASFCDNFCGFGALSTIFCYFGILLVPFVFPNHVFELFAASTHHSENLLLSLDIFLYKNHIVGTSFVFEKLKNTDDTSEEGTLQIVLLRTSNRSLQ